MEAGTQEGFPFPSSSHKSCCLSTETQPKFHIPTNTGFRIPQRSMGMANAMVKSNPPLDPMLITTEKQMVWKSRPICSPSVGSFPGREDRATNNFLLPQERWDFCISENILLFVMIRLSLIYRENHRNVRSDSQQGQVSGTASGMQTAFPSSRSYHKWSILDIRKYLNMTRVLVRKTSPHPPQI